jgi:hypothetical protein
MGVSAGSGRKRSGVSVLPRAVALHPKRADLCRQRVDRLHEALNHRGLRSKAAQALRALIDQVGPIRENGRLEIELGDLAAILALGAAGKQPATEDHDGLPATVVAGGGFEPPTFRL